MKKKIGNLQELISDGNREMKESKGKCNGNEECLMGSPVDWVWPSKE